MNGVERIAAERQRQLTVKGWTAARDAQYDLGQLVDAAVCYADMASMFSAFDRDHQRRRPPLLWPWPRDAWKPGSDNSNASRIRELEKAGALLAAEIDRLLTLDKPAKNA